MLNFEKPFKLTFIVSTFMLGAIIRGSDRCNACSIKNPIAKQIIDFNFEYSYKIQENEVFNGCRRVYAKF